MLVSGRVSFSEFQTRKLAVWLHHGISWSAEGFSHGLERCLGESSPEDETHGNCKHSKMFLIPCPKLMDSFTQHRCFFVARKILVFQLASLHWSTNQPTLLPLHLFTYFPPKKKKKNRTKWRDLGILISFNASHIGPKDTRNQLFQGSSKRIGTKARCVSQQQVTSSS